MARSFKMAVVCSALLTLTLSCGDQSTAPLSDVPAPLDEIIDAAHGGGNLDFFFLPPLVADPTGDAAFNADAFDGSLEPVVEICVLGADDCADTQPDMFPITYTMSDGPGSETVRVDPDAEHYIVNWHTDAFALDATETYRIRVLVAGTELGHADVDVAESGGELRNVNTNEYVPLKDGRTLPIKFRIEQGAVFVVGTDGGTVVAEDGAVTLVILERDAPIGITVQPATGYPDTSALVSGTAFDLGPDGAMFDPPGTLTIRYDPANLPPNTYPRMHHLVGGVWQRVPGSTADLVAHTVSAPVTGFSNWAVLGTGVVLTVHVSGGQGQVSIPGATLPDGTPLSPCSYNDITCATDFTPGTNLTLEAETLGPDAQFEGWSGSGSPSTCTTDPSCSLTMDQDREITATFSMPGLISLSPTTASFSMARSGTPTPTSADITVSNIGGRSLTLASLTTVYSQNVPAWLDVQATGTTIDPGSSITVTLTVLANTLFPGVYNANVLIFDGGQETGGPVPVTLTVTSTGASVTVNGAGRDFGPLPAVPYAFADEATGSDVYPLGDGGFFLFGLFDTGSTRVRVFNQMPYWFNAYPDPNGGLTCNLPNRLTDGNWFNSDAGHLGLAAATTVRVRLNGLSAIDPTTLTAPIGAGEAQVELTGITAEPQSTTSALDVTLLGSPVALQVVAAIDYTQKVTVSGFNFYPGLTDPSPTGTGITGFVAYTAVEGPDITFFNQGDNAIPAYPVQLELGPFGMPVRPVLKNVEFRNQGHYVNDNDPSISPSLLYLYDTGTTPTIIGDQIAGLLNLTTGAGTFSCLGGTNNGYTIDGIVMVGQNGGTYTVNNASVCWSQAGLQSSVLSAVIGSNLFDQVPVVFDGPGNLLGVGSPAASPVTWVAPPRNCP